MRAVVGPFAKGLAPYMLLRVFGSVYHGLMIDDRLAQRAAQWRRVQPVLDLERRSRLAALTEDEARRAVEGLLALVDDSPPKTEISGLVEQQKIFARVGA
jgi:hypothetical protein